MNLASVEKRAAPSGVMVAGARSPVGRALAFLVLLALLAPGLVFAQTAPPAATGPLVSACMNWGDRGDGLGLRCLGPIGYVSLSFINANVPVVSTGCSAAGFSRCPLSSLAANDTLWCMDAQTTTPSPHCVASDIRAAIGAGTLSVDVFPTLTADQGGQIAAALLGVWALAWCLRQIIDMVRKS